MKEKKKKYRKDSLDFAAKQLKAKKLNKTEMKFAECRDKNLQFQLVETLE